MSLFSLIQHVKFPPVTSEWVTYLFLPSPRRELSAAVWKRLGHTLISSFSHPRAMFVLFLSDGFLYVSLYINKHWFASHFTTFSRLFYFFFATEISQLFSFQEVAYLSMVSWHNFISPRHKSYIQNYSFFIIRSWWCFLSSGKIVDLFSLSFRWNLHNYWVLNTFFLFSRFLYTL